MHDVKAIRDDPDAYRRAWASRGLADAFATVDAILSADQRLRAAQTALQTAQSRRNHASKLVGAAKRTVSADGEIHKMHRRHIRTAE